MQDETSSGQRAGVFKQHPAQRTSKGVGEGEREETVRRGEGTRSRMKTEGPAGIPDRAPGPFGADSGGELGNNRVLYLPQSDVHNLMARRQPRTQGVVDILPEHLYTPSVEVREAAQDCSRVALVLAGDVTASECDQEAILRGFVDSFAALDLDLVVIYAMGNHDELESMALEAMWTHGGYASSPEDPVPVAEAARNQRTALWAALHRLENEDPGLAATVQRSAIVHNLLCRKWKSGEALPDNLHIVLGSIDLFEVAPGRCVAVATPFELKPKQVDEWGEAVDEMHWRDPGTLPEVPYPNKQKRDMGFHKKYTTEMYPPGHPRLGFERIGAAWSGQHIDVLVSHADWDGVKALRRLVEPRVHVYGHDHDGAGTRSTDGSTEVLNVAVCRDTNYRIYGKESAFPRLMSIVAERATEEHCQSVASHIEGDFTARPYAVAGDLGVQVGTYCNPRPHGDTATPGVRPIGMTQAQWATATPEAKAAHACSEGLYVPLAQALYDRDLSAYTHLFEQLKSRLAPDPPRDPKRSKNWSGQLKLCQTGNEREREEWQSLAELHRSNAWSMLEEERSDGTTAVPPKRQATIDELLSPRPRDPKPDLSALQAWKWLRDNRMQQVSHVGEATVDWERFKGMTRAQFLADADAVEQVQFLRLYYRYGFTHKAARR